MWKGTSLKFQLREDALLYCLTHSCYFLLSQHWAACEEGKKESFCLYESAKDSGTEAAEMSCTFCLTSFQVFEEINKPSFFFLEIFRVILFRPVDNLLLVELRDCLKKLDASVIHRVM